MSEPRTAAIFDSSDPSSPLAYGPSQTALLLLDFQNVVVGMCGEDGKAALAKAKIMRDWALSKDIFVLHSIGDVHNEPRSTAKGRERVKGLLEMAKANPEIGYESPEIAADTSDQGGKAGELVVKKQLGNVSGLKSRGAMEALRERDIKSLIVCGLSTSGAALRTSIGATDEGFIVTVIEDGCADRVEGLHEMMVKHAMPMSTHVSTAEDFMREFEGGKQA